MTGKKRDSGINIGLGVGDLFKGIGNFIDLLSELAEKGEEITRTQEFTGKGKLKDLKGVYGFSVKLGGLGGPKVESFGNIKKTEAGPTVEEVREPMVDIFEEEDIVQIIAELPGVEENNIKIDLKDDILNIFAEHGNRKYQKEILLSSKVKPETLTVSYKNGILEIKICKL